MAVTPDGRSPFTEWLIETVGATCRPGNPRWQHELTVILEDRIKRPFQLGQLLHPDDLNRLLWRVEELERLIRNLQFQLKCRKSRSAEAIDLVSTPDFVDPKARNLVEPDVSDFMFGE